MMSSPLKEKRKPRSTALFKEDGLRKMLQYNITTSNPKNPNPDHKLRYPNECSASNTNRIADITKRVTHEHDLFLKLKEARLKKATGRRRIEA